MCSYLANYDFYIAILLVINFSILFAENKTRLAELDENLIRVNQKSKQDLFVWILIKTIKFYNAMLQYCIFCLFAPIAYTESCWKM